jgi:hypothetical protein
MPSFRPDLACRFAQPKRVANVYMSLFARIRLEVKRERVQIKKEEKGVE